MKIKIYLFRFLLAFALAPSALMMNAQTLEGRQEEPGVYMLDAVINTNDYDIKVTVEGETYTVMAHERKSFGSKKCTRPISYSFPKGKGGVTLWGPSSVSKAVETPAPKDNAPVEDKPQPGVEKRGTVMPSQPLPQPSASEREPRSEVDKGPRIPKSDLSDPNISEDSIENQADSLPYVDNGQEESESLELMIPIIVVLIGIIAIIAAISVMSRRRKEQDFSSIPKENSEPNKGSVVPGGQTRKILRKQSLEDVYDNPEYMKIECREFCGDSAVRQIYFKNTCVKALYEMYADDLRNPEKPNEDGCFILGRWVYDEEGQVYYVSLEELVMPGDDAVLKEYELNFGTKIRVKTNALLRKLRKETGMQYDLTCWVHSHPGLGVFFSNADSSVHTQLKDNMHPKFLTAIVVDVLTPTQELGIFTFKHDETINSGADLTKKYSLEDMYRWAVKSIAGKATHRSATFIPAEHFNMMAKTTERHRLCHGVHLSHSVVVDLNQYVISESGLPEKVLGFVSNDNGKTAYVVTAITTDPTVTATDQVGLLLTDTHRSLPTICRMLKECKDEVAFVLFYSTADDLLTVMPMVDGKLVEDEKYYGETTLENLKQWNTQKR